MVIKETLGILGSILNIFLQLSPSPGIISGLKKMEIKSMTISYFVVGISQGILWIAYGLNISDIVVYGPNITCYLFFSIYLNILIYVKNKYSYYLPINISLAILCFISIKFFPELLNVSGATIISMCWQTTNIETMKLALKFYDPEYINLLLSIVTFCCFTCMALYSILIKAYIMFIPYFYGAILNFTNIYIRFWAEKKMPKNDCFIQILFKILKPENSDLENNKQDVNENNNNFTNLQNNLVYANIDKNENNF